MQFKNRAEVIARWREIVGIADELMRLEAVDAFMATLVADGCGHIAEEIIDSLPANADRAHALTCYLEELIEHGCLSQARSAVNLARDEDELVQFAFIVAGHTGLPRDRAQVRRVIAESELDHATRAEFYADLFRLAADPEDLAAARREAADAQPGENKLWAWRMVAHASRRGTDLSEMCAATDDDGFMTALQFLLSWQLVPQAIRAAEEFKNAAHRRVATAALRAADPRRPRRFTH